MNRVCFLAIILLFAACTTSKTPERPETWQKIKLDFKSLDADGLAGPAKGKVAVNYEFCIPADNKYWREVRKIDRTVQKNAGKGRINCKADQWLLVGSTHQENYLRVLYQLASLPYVTRIEQTYWE